MELRLDPFVTSAEEAATVQDIYDLHNAGPDKNAGDGITVAVMDTGVDPTHAVFDGVDVTQHDFTGNGEGDEVGHGTATAGLIAQLAPGVEIVSLRIFGDSGQTGMTPILDAYTWLIENAEQVDICNFSWGARSNVPELNEIHHQLLAAGIRDVVAAGNTSGRGGSPATAKDAFSTGAVTVDGELTRFSSYNPDRANPDVSAIGKNVKLARADGTSMGQVIDDQWVKASGTSFAAPITAGFLARFMAVEDGAPRPAFEGAARDIAGTPRDGEGIVDYSEATEYTPQEETVEAHTIDFVGTDVVWLQTDWLEGGTYTAVREPDGTVILDPSA